MPGNIVINYFRYDDIKTIFGTAYTHITFLGLFTQVQRKNKQTKTQIENI